MMSETHYHLWASCEELYQYYGAYAASHGHVGRSVRNYNQFINVLAGRTEEFEIVQHNGRHCLKLLRSYPYDLTEVAPSLWLKTLGLAERVAKDL